MPVLSPARPPGLSAEKVKELKDRIVRNVTKNDRGCWVWRHAPRFGYPHTKVNGKPTMVRRLVYLLWGKRPALGDNQVICTCGNHLCVSPDHLIASTRNKKPRADAQGTD